MKSSQIKGLERIYKRRTPKGELVTPELARYLTELSADIRRQIGIIVNRKGAVVAVIVGDDREIEIPVLSDYPLGRRFLRGVCCVHTHLKGEPLTEDDLTDLALLRLDMMAAIGVGPNGLPATIQTAHLLPVNPTGELYEVSDQVRFHDFDLEYSSFIEALEDELGRESLRDVKDERERAILISVSKESKDVQNESLDELAELASTSDVVVLDKFSQRPAKINPKYLMGSGKIREVIVRALQKEATMLIFDSNLTPAQVREISAVTEMKVIDRTQLILDIFARRAHSKDGRVQVELAQLKYMLPKLSGKGITMSRLMGGIGGRGPGESKLEVDRRRVGERISRLENELKALSRSRYERRRKRASGDVPIISITGYTNAGKSTLLNGLTKSDVLVEDKLFATLDTTTRRLRFPRERDAVLTDTVGFIRRLPEELLKAFKATLEEMEDADLLLHLVDISNPLFASHIDTVESILVELGLGEIPRLLVFNKTELLDPEMVRNLCERYEAIGVSALDNRTLAPLLRTLEARLWPGETGGYYTSEETAQEETATDETAF
ncbi:MAG: GTPase HflX, partial [Proteobacteria bacterium]|nr:GTPase HflX [Pseudomonadota bacterium]